MDPRLIGILAIIAIAVVTALVIAKFKQQSDRTDVLETKLGVAVVPFFKYVLTVLAQEVTHPHKKYKVLDGLIAEALLEPEVRMEPERLALMDRLLDERSADTSSDMRPGENQKALIVKQLVHLIRMEGASDIPLTGFTVVGRQQPELQKGDDGEQEKTK